MLFPAGRVRFRRELESNYYVYCLAERLSTRLLYDFEADACLIIRDPAAFLARFQTAVDEQIPGWRYLAKEVEYFDPLQVQPNEVDVLTWKHFRYAYQQEMRLAWLPPKPVRELAPLYVTLGNLEDVAELIRPVPIAPHDAAGPRSTTP